ncbi:mediator of RNA polymerase II transcription subunit 26 isoform X1 [Polypterus senegalus]|uniref:mediator of RNA polymerase II transcription subunit 26 isoform X1 n=1 Tax=Polypterus senegalus TaxID=55291 RepID=UPI0019669BA6|nr:mediator of RNA polymerase II transcription subunit 26 isoform X1 [Polypterus senegalus]
MTAASATPQQMRDRLLQAIDSQSNQIRDMGVVQEVISSLEKYPITKEALEETRLGKLINDVRKKTNNEDLAKRAKKLLRNWQKLIEPGQADTAPRVPPPGSANGGAHPLRQDVLSPCPASLQELKSRSEIQIPCSPKAERSGSRKRKGELRDGFPPAKLSKVNCDTVHNSSPPPTNGISGSPEPLPSPPLVAERSRLEASENDRQNKIPVNAVKPHTSSPGLVKVPSTSSLLKAAVLQQQAKADEVVGASCPPRSPRCASFSPRSIKQETLAKQPTIYATCSPRPSIDASQVPSSPSPHLLTPLPVPASPPLPVSETHSQHPKTEACKAVGLPHSEIDGGVVLDGVTPGSESKRKKKYRPRDYTVNLDGQPTLEENSKPVRLKERKLTFDPVTGQIKPLTHKDSLLADEVSPHHRNQMLVSHPAETHRTELLKQEPGSPTLTSPFQKTNWKELACNNIIQSYLNKQSSLLSSSGAQTPGAHYFMTEYLKQEEHNVKEARKTHVLVASSTQADLPGVNRELCTEDLQRIHEQHWPGVNGCFDTKDNWYDWTQCISLDPHGDETRLHILPYVCLD